MTRRLTTYTIEYCEWQTFSIDIPADSEGHALTLAQSIREHTGTDLFTEQHGGSDGFTIRSSRRDPPKTKHALWFLLRLLSALDAIAQERVLEQIRSDIDDLLVRFNLT